MKSRAESDAAAAATTQSELQSQLVVARSQYKALSEAQATAKSGEETNQNQLLLVTHRLDTANAELEAVNKRFESFKKKTAEQTAESAAAIAAANEQRDSITRKLEIEQKKK